MTDAKQLLHQILEILNELEIYERYKEEMVSKSHKLYKDYQKGKFGYLAYQQRLKELLQGKTKEEWVSYYESYAYSLLKRVEYLLSQAFYLTYRDESYKLLKASPDAKAADKKAPDAAKGVQASEKSEPAGHMRVFDLETELKTIQQKYAEQSQASSQAASKKHEIEQKIAELKGRLEASHNRRAQVPEKRAEPAARKTPSHLILAAKGIATRIATLIIAIFSIPKRIFAGIGSVFRRKPQHSVQPAQKPKPSAVASLIEKPKKSLYERFMSQFEKKKTIFYEEIVSMEKKREAPAEVRKAKSESAIVGWFAGPSLFKELINREIIGRLKSRQEPVLSEQTIIPTHMKRLREMREKLYEEERVSAYQSTLLVQEASRLKKILEVQKQETYKGSSLGIIANVTVKRISLFMVDKFPGFFSHLYNALRAANIRMLSNTYVNIMILSTMIISIFTTLALLVVFFILNNPLYDIFLKSIMLGAIAGGLCAGMFYMYPFMRIKERRKSTLTNLPFAIGHMSSVSTSGVPPSVMFELISGSQEYGEIAVEIKKIVDFINIFGYDLLTAMRSVATTTPSPQFKEFLEGFVSTIETGGDLESFLKQKGEEATLTYQLERQRYNQNISTYSDVYTGLLIAAPLFFIAALALVNLLGGKIGGLGVDVVMALGAYIAIPLMNIAFLLFLQVNQPEV